MLGRMLKEDDKTASVQIKEYKAFSDWTEVRLYKIDLPSYIIDNVCLK